MIRGLRYSIQFATSNELTLVHEMTLDEDSAEGPHESFSIEGDGVHGTDFTPAQMVLLHRAIDEMLRMAEQHRDALTDGAGERVAEADPPPYDYLAILRSIACGCMLEHNTVTNGWKHMLGGKVSHGGCVLLLAKGLIESNGPMHSVGQPHVNGYLISTKGRRALAAQTPEAESEPAPDEALVLNRAEKEVLRALAHGDALWLKNDRAGLYRAVPSVKEESIKSLWDKRLIGPGDEPANMVDGMEDGLLWYCITDKGRRVLAEREG